MRGGRFGVGVLGGARGVAVRRAGGQVPRAGHGGGRRRGAVRWALRAGGTLAARHLLGHRFVSLAWLCWLVGERHKKSPRAGRQSRGARRNWLGQLAARRPSTRICESFTGNTLLRSVTGTLTDGVTVSHSETGRLIRFVLGWLIGRLPGGPDQRLDTGGGHRPGDQEALAVVAAHLAQRTELAGLLDALGDDPQPELAADLHHGPGQQGQGV